MMALLTSLVGVGCLLAICWWVVALVQIRALLKRSVGGTSVPRPEITFFKAFPACRSDDEAAMWQHSVESLLPHLAAGDELLVGIHACDQARFAPWVDALQATDSQQCLRVIYATPPGLHINQKVDWMHCLAKEATKPLWFWSDADIEVPASFGDALAADAARLAPGGMMTYAYRIDQPGSVWSLLDAAFVNATMLPGLALMRNKPELCFALGAGMLFRAEDFQKRVDWGELGRQLTDDNFLGRTLSPSRLGTVTLTTRTGATGPRAALSHYYRWEKTIRWTEPLGYFCQLLVQPLAFTLLGFAILPLSTALPLLLVMLWLECLYLSRAFRIAGMKGAASLLALPLVPPVRLLVWLAVWLPIGVRWRGVYWARLRYDAKEAAR